MGQRKSWDIPFFPNIQYIILSSSMSSEGVLMFFMPEFVQKLFFTVRSFKWSFNWDFCTHQHFSGLPWITEMLLRTTNISFDRVPEVLHTVESTLMSQLCQKVILIFFFYVFWSWQNKLSAQRLSSKKSGNLHSEGSNVDNPRKNKNSPESSEIQWDKGTNVIFFSFLFCRLHITREKLAKNTYTIQSRQKRKD